MTELLRPPESRRASYVAGGEVDTTVSFVMLDAVAVAKLLPPGLVLEAVPGAPAGRHPVWLDLGQIAKSKMEVRGIDQHLAGRAAGAVMGMSSGAVGVGTIAMMLGWGLGPLGALAGGTIGAGMGGAMWGVMGALSGELSSRVSSTLVGSYREAIVGIPNVRAARGQKLYTYIVGMRLDSVIATAGERAWGYGYNKKLAGLSINRGNDSARYEVVDGGARLSATSCNQGAWRHPSASPELAPALRLMTQPKLGRLAPTHDGQAIFAVSHLDRFFAAPEVEVAPASVMTQIQGEGFLGLPAQRHTVQPLSAENPFGAFRVRNLVEKVDTPKRVMLAQL